MAALSTLGQKTVGTSAVQLTADTPAASAPFVYGVKLSVAGTQKVYYGYSNAVTTSNGFYVGAAGEIPAKGCQFVGDVWLISDTASTPVCFEIVDQLVTIS